MRQVRLEKKWLKKQCFTTLSALFPHSHRLLRMESTWLIFVSLLLAANLLATVLTEGAPTPTTVVTQEPITIPFVKVCRLQSTCTPCRYCFTNSNEVRVYNYTLQLSGLRIHGLRQHHGALDLQFRKDAILRVRHIGLP